MCWVWTVCVLFGIQGALPDLRYWRLGEWMEEVVGSEDMSWRVVVPEVIRKLIVSLEIVRFFISSSGLGGRSDNCLGYRHLLGTDTRSESHWLVIFLGS